MAELLGIENRESQAYFKAFIAMPFGALLGIVTGASWFAAISAKTKKASISVALAGTILLTVVASMGVYWAVPKRPAQFRVQNETTAPLYRTYLGHDFRRTTSLGTIQPGSITDYHTVDLTERGSFNAVRALHRGRQIQLTLDLSLQTSLEQGRYTYVVREQANMTELKLVRD